MGNHTDTPLMRQYLQIKSQNPDAILFFRLGDFYEMFLDDAEVASRALDLTLTSRDKSSENPVPMCGVPHHAANGYLKRLLELGHKVAICEQVEDPKLARGIVRRAVTQVITPGVVLDTNHLDARTNNFLTAIAGKGRRFGLASLDLSTFELQLSEVDGASALVDELARRAPKEVLFDARATELLAPIRAVVNSAWQEARDGIYGKPAADRELVAQHVPESSSAPAPLLVTAAAAALRYAASTQPETKIPRCRLLTHDLDRHLLLDEATLRNLEIFESVERKRSGSLLAVIDQTLTAGGARLLRRCLALPLRDVAEIRRRQGAVALLVEQGSLRARLRDTLKTVHDLERLTSRAVMSSATARQLRRLGDSLRALPQLAEMLDEAQSLCLGGEAPTLLSAPEDLLVDVADGIDACLVEDPPLAPKEGGGVIRRGFSAELDGIIDLCEGGKNQILAIEQRERQQTKIGSLKVRYNKVFGYFIEVTKANLKLVPEHYQRKQTLANAERFVTEELTEYEAKVLSAQRQRSTLEQQLFEALRDRVAVEASRLVQAAERIALTDMLCGLAEVAQLHDYVRPDVDASDTIDLVDARHPVVERFIGAEFIPNDLRLDDRDRLLILTGPNMAGKSTAMRQVALITILSQIGSFVPCRQCRVGMVDRIFTRVGASDNLARGDSTFMVEMRETANIISHATAASLVILDEIGRGTATYDGISIAWAVAEYLHDKVGARTLFATHYHELCALEEVKQKVKNLTISTQEWKGNVVFLRKLVEGAASRSYGIEVARLAGLEPRVLKRAREILGVLESGNEVPGVPLGERTRTNQLGLFEARREPIADDGIHDALCCLDPSNMTPLEALNTLAELVEEAQQKRSKN